MATPLSPGVDSSTGADPGPGVDPRTPEEAEELLRQIARTSHTPGSLSLPGLFPADQPRQNLQTLAERRYRALVEQIPVVTFLAALDQNVQELYVSPQIEALLGFTQKQWLEDPFLWYNQLHPDDQQRWALEFARTCATGTQFRAEYRFIARDGRVVWVHGECQIVRDDRGTPLFLQGVAYDITESRKAQEILQRTSQELETRVQERTAELRDEVQRRQELAEQLVQEAGRKDQFLAVLAHELRNPLAPLLPALDLLRREEIEPDPEQRRWAIDMIGRQVGQMSRLIDDLLDVSRISRGKVSLQKSPIEISLVLDRAVEVVQPLLEKRGHHLGIQKTTDSTLVVGDPVRLEQIIVNLLTNAAKYTEPGGRIDVELARQQREVVLRVRDNGIGIPPAMLERIFEMFTQVDSSLDRTTQWGLGIGLALVRGLIELHQGTVTASSEGPGQGSVFTVRLPAAPAEIAAELAVKPAPAQRKPAQPSLPRRKILVVEDNADAARALFLLLRAWGQDVVTVPDGPSALAAIAADPPDIALMDIGLPRMDGYEIARRVRAQHPTQPITLVALSGYGQPEDRARARQAGFDHYLTKPVPAASLRALLTPA